MHLFIPKLSSFHSRQRIFYLCQTCFTVKGSIFSSMCLCKTISKEITETSCFFSFYFSLSVACQTFAKCTKIDCGIFLNHYNIHIQNLMVLHFVETDKKTKEKNVACTHDGSNGDIRPNKSEASEGTREERKKREVVKCNDTQEFLLKTNLSCVHRRPIWICN